jgi:hypothetical protein
MCTIGGIIRDGTVLLFKNFDYPPVARGWAQLIPSAHGHEHLALVDHDQRGVNSGLNRAGLGLVISRSEWDHPSSPESEELRTVANAEMLTRFSTVRDAVDHLEGYVRDHPRMYGGNVILADCGCLSVTEHLGEKHRTEIVTEGSIARANHSVFGLVNNEYESSQRRYSQMVAFLEGIEDKMARIGTPRLIDLGKRLLRTPPILNENTRSSFLIDLSNLAVHHLTGGERWRRMTFSGEG